MPSFILQGTDTMQFTEEQMRFLAAEFGYSKDRAASLSEDELLELSDKCFDIELEGDLQDSGTVSGRCRIASEIVTMINEEFG